MHKRIGILGGMSPESKMAYYQYLTRSYAERYGNYGYCDELVAGRIRESSRARFLSIIDLHTRYWEFIHGARLRS